MKKLMSIAALLLCSTSLALAAQSFKYEPSIVKLHGTLRSAPGQTPDGEDLKYPALQLHSPITVEGDQETPTEIGVLLIHMVLDSNMMAMYKKYKGKSVSVTGTLFHSHTDHHQTNVLITPSAITPR